MVLGSWGGVQSVNPISDCLDVQPAGCGHVDKCVQLVPFVELSLLFLWVGSCFQWEEYTCSLHPQALYLKTSE